MNAPPSTHPRADAIRQRLKRPLAQASAAPPVRVLIELLNNRRGLGWTGGDARLRLVRDLHKAMVDARYNVTLDDLCAAYGAGEWEPA